MKRMASWQGRLPLIHEDDIFWKRNLVELPWYVRQSTTYVPTRRMGSAVFGTRTVVGYARLKSSAPRDSFYEGYNRRWFWLSNGDPYEGGDNCPYESVLTTSVVARREPTPAIELLIEREPSKWLSPVSRLVSESLADAISRVAEERKVFWANSVWELDTRTLVLRHRETHYEVDLGTCRTSAEVLDWLAQVRPKYDEKDFLALFEALNLLIRFQERMCTYGTEKMNGRNWAQDGDFTQGVEAAE